MIPRFDVLRTVDVSQYTEKRDGFDYLNWARCKALLHEQGAEVVTWEPVTNEKGSSLIRYYRSRAMPMFNFFRN